MVVQMYKMNTLAMSTRSVSSAIADGVPFAKAKIGRFFQDRPQLHNPYTTDGPLKRFLKRMMPSEVFSFVEADLTRFGKRVVEEVDDIGRECELNLPYLKPFDAWGRRTDNLITSTAWKRMKVISAQEGIVACGYEKRFGEYDRLYQYAKLYLYAPSGGLYGCPLAMTDGAAKVIMEVNPNDKNLRAAFDRLTTRDPDKFWTSGQWMTEKKGGSDVASGTETVAYHKGDGFYTLHGYKWFSSATDADMSLTLARPVATDSSTISGTKGLSLFYVQVRDPNTKQLNNIEIVRLKEKLGTRQVPTAELLLDGAIAQKVSDDGRGVASIANMLNITRIHNAVSGAAAMRRILSLSRDYTFRRKVFGKNLVEHPLHVQTLARMEAVPLISEGLESFGGMGYMEDTGLPCMLRDAQVLPIWEGTTNVLSMDVLRHLAKEGQAVTKAYVDDILAKTEEASRSVALSKSAAIVNDSVAKLIKFVLKNMDKMELAARDFAISLSRCYIGALLLEHASSSVATDDDVETAIRWCQPDRLLEVKPDYQYSSEAADLDKALLLNEYPGVKSG